MKKTITGIFSVFDGKIRRIVREYSLGPEQKGLSEEKEYRLVRGRILLRKISDTEFEYPETGKRYTV